MLSVKYLERISFKPHSRQGHGGGFVPDEKVRIDSRSCPAHDGDEHGEGGVDQAHVQDQGNHQGRQVEGHPLPIWN